MPSTRPTTRKPARAGLAAVGLLTLGACSAADGGGTSGGSSDTSATSRGPIVVTASDTECTLSTTSVSVGSITFQVRNTGTKVNEFYVYASGDRIVGEAENITPGLSRDLTVEISEPGALTTACKPGMVGDGIRAPFTVTGAAVQGQAGY